MGNYGTFLLLFPVPPFYFPARELLPTSLPQVFLWISERLRKCFDKNNRYNADSQRQEILRPWLREVQGADFRQWDLLRFILFRKTIKRS
ncbi:hypothetical protein GCWU000341_00577 [Oribacterium sp. oral taxon 078 str. F0262]|nr:hypothetical protein GCWU000341_00577 [Oribacterium sp. oral taxon 078 str. F0262]